MDFKVLFSCSLRSLFDAGPIVVIATLLVLVFTVGLSDDESQPGVSAYSVFNRGFNRILGSIDVENLVQQYVAGGVVVNQQQQNDAQMEREENGNQDRRQRQHQPQRQENGERGGRSRKSGKKARRRNLEQRRELQRQRQAAREMGFGDGNDAVMLMQATLNMQEAELHAMDLQREEQNDG